MVIAPAPRVAASPSAPLIWSSRIWSSLAICLGFWWWWQPQHYPFGPGDPGTFATLMGALPGAAVPPVLVAAGVWGLVAVWLAVQRQTARGTTIAVVGTGAAYAVAFGLVAPGLQPLTLVGYAMAMFGPVVLFAAVLTGAWRWRGGPWAVGVFVLVAGLGWVTGLADGAVLLGYVGLIAETAHKAGPSAVLLFFLVGGLLWGVLGARMLLRAAAGRPAPRWTRPDAATRWGKVAVVIAAVSALPYGLMRLTWLTPWALFGGSELASSPEIRLHGLLLGFAALAGAILTTGLVARWGEVWPRWVPVVRGRPVPVPVAVVPGTLVAALFTVAAIPIAVVAVTSGRPVMLLIFPFPVWGPALGAAVLAYALRRRGDLATPGTIEVS
jgi:hypothetical protein